MMSRRNEIVKYCAYGFLLLGLFILQTARGTALPQWGLELDLIPFFVMALALFEGPYAAGCYGFAAGLLCAVGSPFVDGLLALHYGVAGTLCGLFAPRYMRPILPSALLLGTIVSGVKGIFAYVFYYRLMYDAPLGRGLLLLAGDVAVSVLPAIAVYFAARAIYLRFTEKDKA